MRQIKRHAIKIYQRSGSKLLQLKTKVLCSVSLVNEQVKDSLISS